MPNRKKRVFTKANSTKYILLHGAGDTRNADGESLPTENMLIPAPKNHKPGNSLLMAGLSNFCDDLDDEGPLGKVTSQNNGEADLDLEKILESFGDGPEINDEISDTIRSGIKKLKIPEKSTLFENSNIRVEILDGDSDCSDDIFGQFSDAEEESDDEFKPGFSRTSQRTDCPESLQVLNERFDKLFDEEYDDDQIGALDDEEICGVLTAESEQVKNLAEIPLAKEEEFVEIGDCDAVLKEKILRFSETEEATKMVEITIKKPLEFDCESILSTYSNMYNHPAVIKEESKIRKIRIPDNPLQRKLTKSLLKQLDDPSSSDSDSECDDLDQVSVATSFNVRLKGETPEQKRERKNLFKEAKRESRKMKKENKLAFKEERKIQKSQDMNSRNTKGIKLI